MNKRWIIYLFVCLFFTACKSTDCGCPMASKDIHTIQPQQNASAQQEFSIKVRTQSEVKD